MPNVGNVIKGMECCIETSEMCWDNPKCPYNGCEDMARGEGCMSLMMRDALALLKAQEKATIEPKRIDLDDETRAWLDKMDAADALGNIADICMDWDGYRTVNGLGGLVNEIWAYARYCADRLLKAQEPRVMKVGDVRNWVNSDRVTREPVVIEIRGGVCAWIIDDEVRELPGEENLSSDLYGVTWRCWTSRPTDKQREAEPWRS